MTVIVNNGRDFHPLADHVTKLRNFTKGEIRFPFSLQLVVKSSRSMQFL